MVAPITTIRTAEPQGQPARRGRQDIAHMRRMARLSARRRSAKALIRRANAAPPLRPDEAAEILFALAICVIIYDGEQGNGHARPR